MMWMSKDNKFSLRQAPLEIDTSALISVY